MKKVTKLQVNDWCGKKYTSASHLNDLFLSGVINREEKIIGAGLHWKETSYTFITHHGVELATIHKYSDFGFSSQAHGVELKAFTLKNPKRIAIDRIIYDTDKKIRRSCQALDKMLWRQFAGINITGQKILA